MRIMALVAAMFLFQFVQSGCSTQEGSITGNVTPVPGIRITVTQNGRAVTQLEPSEKTGNFALNLETGTYDIAVKAPDQPFPIVIQHVLVEKGKTTELQTIAVTTGGSDSRATLSGRITPAQASIALLSEGKEMAAVKTDPDGLYIFQQVPIGTYTLRVTSVNYASDSFPINVSQGGTTQDARLLYSSAREEVDWTAGKIRVTGRGAPPDKITNPTIRREMAGRAALADAERKLVKAVAEIKTGPDQNIRSYLGEGNFSRKIQGYIKGYRVTGERDLNDGWIEVDLELPLTGQNGLSRYLFD